MQAPCLIPALFLLTQRGLTGERSLRCVSWASLLAASPTPSAPTEFPELEPQRERWEQRQQWRRQLSQRRHRRSVSKEKWVETLVVADAKMVEYHGQPNVESYVLTIMNMVRLLQAACGGGGEGCQEVVLVSPKGVIPGPKPGTGFQLLSHWEGTWADVRLEVLAPHWLSSLCPLLGPEWGEEGMKQP